MKSGWEELAKMSFERAGYFWRRRFMMHSKTHKSCEEENGEMEPANLERV